MEGGRERRRASDCGDEAQGARGPCESASSGRGLEHAGGVEAGGVGEEHALD